jgi:hypothetical protein
MKKEQKQLKQIKLNQYLDWSYGVSIQKMKQDLHMLENIGATHISIALVDDFGGGESISIEPIMERLETDEEFKERVKLNKIRIEEAKKRELDLFNKLKAKYESKSEK